MAIDLNTKDLEFYHEFMNSYQGAVWMREVSLNTDKGVMFKQLIEDISSRMTYTKDKSILQTIAGRVIDIIFREYVYSPEWSEEERESVLQLPPFTKPVTVKLEYKNGEYHDAKKD